MTLGAASVLHQPWCAKNGKERNAAAIDLPALQATICLGGNSRVPSRNYAGPLSWFTVSTAGPVSLLIKGSFRAGLRSTGISTGNAIEATLGSLWGEDPRYFPSPLRGFRSRMKSVIRSTFLARRKDGHWHPAYVHYIGNVGNSFLSNTWRVASARGRGDVGVRCVWGVASQMVNDTFLEFWPDVKRRCLGNRERRFQIADFRLRIFDAVRDLKIGKYAC